MNDCFDSLHGTVVKNNVIAGFNLSETFYPLNLRLPRHSHCRAYFCFVLRGTFTENYDNRTRLCRPSTLIFHPEGETHSDEFHTDGRCFNVQIGTRWMTQVREHTRAVDSPASSRGGFVAQLARRLYKEFRETDDLSALIAEGLMLEIIGESARKSVKHVVRSPPRWLEQARELLNERFAESLTLTHVAATVGVHPAHLAREFRRYFHHSVGEYVRQRRVEVACHKIATSDLPLSEISLAVGFFDQSHFARTFKLIKGMTPAVYRALSRTR